MACSSQVAWIVNNNKAMNEAFIHALVNKKDACIATVTPHANRLVLLLYKPGWLAAKVLPLQALVSMLATSSPPTVIHYDPIGEHFSACCPEHACTMTPPAVVDVSADSPRAASKRKLAPPSPSKLEPNQHKRGTGRSMDRPLLLE